MRHYQPLKKPTGVFQLYTWETGAWQMVTIRPDAWRLVEVVKDF